MNVRSKKNFILSLIMISSVSLFGCSLFGNKLESDEEIKISDSQGERFVSDEEVLILKKDLNYWDRSVYKSGNMKDSDINISKTIAPQYTPYIYNLNSEKEEEIDKIKLYNNYIISNDGTYLVYEEWREGEEDKQSIKVYNFKTKGVSELNFNNEDTVVNLNNTVWIDEKSFIIGLDKEESLYKVNIDNGSIEPIQIEGIDLNNPRILGINNGKMYYYSHKSKDSLDADDEKMNEFIINSYDLENKENKEVLKDNFTTNEPKVLFYTDGLVVVDVSSGQTLNEDNVSYIKKYDFSGNKVGEIKVNSIFDYRVGTYINNSGDKFVYGDYDETEDKYIVHVADMITGDVKEVLKADKIMPIKYDRVKDKFILGCKAKTESKLTTYIINNLEKQKFIDYEPKENVDKEVEECMEKLVKEKGIDRNNYKLYDTKLIKGETYYGFESKDSQVTNKVYVNHQTNEILEDNQELYVNDEALPILISDRSIK